MLSDLFPPGVFFYRLLLTSLNDRTVLVHNTRFGLSGVTTTAPRILGGRTVFRF